MTEEKELPAMRKSNTFLICLLLAALVLCFAAGLLLDPASQSAAQPAGVYHVQISEICAKNETIIADNDGKYRDYIELYNAGEDTDLTGCHLTDGSVSYSFDGLTLRKGEYRVLFLGKETTGFALSASGRDSIQLQDPAGNILAQAKLQSVTADQVMVCENGVWQLSSSPSPGFPNTSDGIHAFRTGTKAETLDIQVSEILIANRSSLPDENGVFSDVVELHNETSESISLSGWYLSDRVEQRFRFRLPDVSIPAGGYLLILCDGENYTAGNGTIHANFALTAKEELCLTDPAGNYLTVAAQYSADDLSLAWTESGYQLMQSSLGFPNTEDGCIAAQESRINTNSALVISEVLLSSSGVPVEGRLTDAVELLNRSSEPVSTAGWYLSDGGDPYAHPLPDRTLSAGERMVVTISRESTGFSLARDEAVYLLGPDYYFSPLVPCDGIPLGSSMSLAEGGDTLSYTLAGVSLGFPNTATGAKDFQAAAASNGLQLSEAMSANGSYLPGPFANTTDWVELYNASGHAIDLSGYYLTDSENLQQHPLPEKTLGSGDYMVVLLSSDGKNLPEGYDYLPMNLSSDGDLLYLAKDGIIVDYLILPALAGDTAFGRPAGAGFTAQLATPTPGKANSTEARISQMPAALQAQGAYDDVTSLVIGFSGAGEIYYTTDCTEPDRNSKRYTEPIEITKTTVFRVCAYEAGCTRSEILDLTYLINEGDTLATVCLVTEPDNLWSDYTGIYSAGHGAASHYPYIGANYWKDIEKPATVSLFEENGIEGFSESCGLKIFGGFSRAQKKKSFACMFRNKFGESSLDYPLFGEEGLGSFQNFVLRAGGQDVYSSKFRDEMITSLASDYLDMPVQQYRPVVLYLNGEYWGIYFIREKLNDQYVAAHYNVDKDDVTLTSQEGRECLEYTELRRYALNHDLTEQEHYDYICQNIDVRTYMDHVIIQMWIENRDLGNVKFFKSTQMPWTWALFDTDVSMQDPSRNTIDAFLTKSHYHPHDQYARDFVNRLMPHPEFQDAFLRRVAYQLNTVWNEQVVTERIDYFYDLLKNDIEKECARWGSSVSEWERSIQVLRNFAAKRTSYFVEDIQQYFQLTDAQMRDYGFEV